jgi:hypothetical protein
MIVAFSGKKGHGKDTAAEVLTMFHGFKKLSFAGPLKSWVSKSLVIPIYKLEEQEFKNRPHANGLHFNLYQTFKLVKAISKDYKLSLWEKLKVGSKVYWKPFFTYREILQFIGTEVCRLINKDIFVHIMRRKIKNQDNYVITDCRFENERILVKMLGGRLVFIENPNKLNAHDPHPSENSFGPMCEYDVVIYNNSTIEDLQYKINKLYNKRFTINACSFDKSKCQ